MVKRILFVVHRAYPYPGGSEIYVHNMAKECWCRGYDVTILAHEHKGDYEGIKITNDYHILEKMFDLIVVHGGDCISQNVVHLNAGNLISPVLYLLIKPSLSEICMNGLVKHDFIGWSSNEDWRFILKHKVQDKAVYVPHGIPLNESLGNPDRVQDHLKDLTGKTFDVRKYFVSAGGWWPHKGMDTLAKVWEEAHMPDDTYLVLFGYSDHKPPTGKNIITVHKADHHMILDFIAGSEAYLMNSYEEGFGLVLLEAMINWTPWISRPHAGAQTLNSLGTIIINDWEMIEALKSFKRNDKQIAKAYEYVMKNHLIGNTINGIESVLK
jgi:glycosyltransferase involved in cell wall biosynthesis